MVNAATSGSPILVIILRLKVDTNDIFLSKSHNIFVPVFLSLLPFNLLDEGSLLYIVFFLNELWLIVIKKGKKDNNWYHYF